MTTFVSKWSARLNFAFLLLMSGAGVGLFVWRFFQPTAFPSETQRWALTAPLLLMFGGGTLYSLWNLLETFAVYILDEHGIVKRGWNGSTRRFAWDDITDHETRRLEGMTLINSQGERMRIPLNYGYNNAARQGLGATLQQYLTESREGNPSQDLSTREFRFGNSTATRAAMFMAAIALALGICMPLMPFSPPAPPAFRIGMCLFGFGSALFFLVLALTQSTRTLKLTPTHLIDQNLFRRREIALAQIEAIFSKEISAKSGPVEVTTVQSANGKITFPAMLPNYHKLVQALHARTGVQGTRNAAQAMARDASSQRRQTVVGLFVVGSLLGLGFIGIAQMILQGAEESQARNAQMDARGQTTTGRVTGVETRGSKSTTYYLDYTFLVAGQSYSSLSPVVKIDYDNAQTGDSVQVTYLPENPHVCRIAQSISKQRNAERMQAAHMMIGVACGLPFLLVVLGLLNKTKYLPTPKR